MNPNATKEKEDFMETVPRAERRRRFKEEFRAIWKGKAERKIEPSKIGTNRAMRRSKNKPLNEA